MATPQRTVQENRGHSRQHRGSRGRGDHRHSQSSRSFRRDGNWNRGAPDHGDRGGSRDYSRSRSRTNPRREGNSRSRSPPARDVYFFRQPRHSSPMPSFHTRNSRTVLLSQLVVKASSRDVEHFFRTLCPSRRIFDMAFLRHKNSGESKGMVYVEFESVDDAEDVLSLNGERFVFATGKVGLPCCVERAVDPNIPLVDPNEEEDRRKLEIAAERHARTVLVSNIDDSISGDDLGKIFGPLGDLQHIRIDEGGYGELLYGRAAEAKVAVQQLNGLTLVGKALRLRLAAGGEPSAGADVNKRRKTVGAENVNSSGGGEEANATTNHMVQADWTLEDRNFGGGYKLTAERRVQMMQNMQKHVEGGK